MNDTINFDKLMQNYLKRFNIIQNATYPWTATKIEEQTMPPQWRHQYERGGTLCLRSGGMSGKKG